MKKLLLCAAATMFLLAPVFSSSQEEKFMIYGFSYFTPPEEVGTVTTVLAFLEPPVGFDYPITMDFVNNEYTFYFQSTITDIQVEAVTTIYTYSDAPFYIYEDPSKNGDYGVNPPNATAPSTFVDGLEILSGTLSDISRVDYNMGFPEPTIVAACTFTGGSKFGELFQGENWTFHGGLSSNPLLGIPEGYQRNWATEIIFSGPLPTEASTWGKIKALYGDR